MKFSVYDVSSESVSDSDRIGSVLVRIDDIILGAGQQLTEPDIASSVAPELLRQSLIDGVGNCMVYQLLHDNAEKQRLLADATISIRFDGTSLAPDLTPRSADNADAEADDSEAAAAVPSMHMPALSFARLDPLAPGAMPSHRAGYAYPTLSSCSDPPQDDSLHDELLAPDEDEAEDDADHGVSDEEASSFDTSIGSTGGRRLARTRGGPSLHRQAHESNSSAAHPSNAASSAADTSQTPLRRQIDSMLSDIANERFSDDDADAEDDEPLSADDIAEQQQLRLVEQTSKAAKIGGLTNDKGLHGCALAKLSWRERHILESRL